nr:MAG TPA_asm: hypothetical protein [Caudoviricetes sp.]
MKSNDDVMPKAKSAQRNIMLKEVEYVIRLATGHYRIELIDKKDFVIIDHNDGTYQMARVECDGLLEMAYDIMKAALHGEYYETKRRGSDDEGD